jgi:MFS family permease
MLFFASFNMIIPELPDFLTSLGGADYKGLIISLFTLTAMLSRPFSGKLSDTIGRVPVMLLGALVCLVCSLIYPLLTSVAGFMLLRFIHGFSTGFTPTGQAAYLGDIIPTNKRGEAMGILGTAGTVGMAAGPAIGGAVANNFTLDALFYLSSFFGLVSVIIVMSIKETLGDKRRFTPATLRIQKQDLFEPLVWVPCVIMALYAYSYGAIFTLLPDLGEFVGIKNKGVLFTFLTVASLAVRLLAGKASDYYGRVSVLRVSTFFLVISLIIIGVGQESWHMMLGISLYGMGQGMTSPTLLAWATDLSDKNFKGRGISSLYIFMEAGIGIGAFVSGWMYGNDPANFFVTFLVCTLLSAGSFLYLVFGKTPVQAAT